MYFTQYSGTWTNLHNVRIMHHVTKVQYVEPQENHFFVDHYIHKHSTPDTGMFG
jgi:hypothetical protein